VSGPVLPGAKQQQVKLLIEPLGLLGVPCHNRFRR
jgi:hypothetical protein